MKSTLIISILFIQFYSFSSNNLSLAKKQNLDSIVNGYSGGELMGMAGLKNGKQIWWANYKADKDYLIPVKGFHIKVDSVYIICPFPNGNIWYEGLFILKREYNDTTPRTVMTGVHKIYYPNGKLHGI